MSNQACGLILLDSYLSMEPTTQKYLQTLAVPIAIIIAGSIIAGTVFFGIKGNGNTAVASAQQPPTPQQIIDVSKVNTHGEPSMGSQNAPVTIAYWYDYQCPFCKQNEETAMPQLVKEYVDTGKVKIVFKDFQFLGDDSQTLGQFSRAVWTVAPTMFYQWHEAVYDNQGTENTGWATQEKILSITKDVLGAGKTDQVAQLVKANGASYQKEMDADKTEGSEFGVSGTPSFIIGKQRIDGAVPYAQIKASIEAALANK